MQNAQAAICVGAADVRREPDASSELVTQALLGAPAVPEVTDGAWQHVRLVDYEGWVRAEHRALLPSGSPVNQVVVVTALSAPLFALEAGDSIREMIFLSTVVPLAEPDSQAERLAVSLPGGVTGWVRAADIEVRQAQEPFPLRDVDFVIETARRFLGVPYLWGGTTCQGIDCSGLIQLCFRMAGFVLPRDSRQQFAGLSVEPMGEPGPGDLLFFAKEGRIVHVGLSLGDGELIHAEGVTWNRVLRQSMNPAHADRYNHRLVELYCGARRVMEANAE